MLWGSQEVWDVWTLFIYREGADKTGRVGVSDSLVGFELLGSIVY